MNLRIRVDSTVGQGTILGTSASTQDIDVVTDSYEAKYTYFLSRVKVVNKRRTRVGSMNQLDLKVKEHKCLPRFL